MGYMGGFNKKEGLGFDELAYGYDRDGIEDYLNKIHDNYLMKAKEKVEDISSIRTACDTVWHGKAKDNFLKNLEKDSKHVGAQMEKLYNVLKSELESLEGAMANKDEEMIQVDD